MINSIYENKKMWLNKINVSYLQRKRRVIESKHETMILIQGKYLINFCSNDYLNLSHHEEVKKSFAKHAHDLGLGSTSAALVSGFHQSHLLLEEEFADFLNRDKALLFNSGYHANLGVLTSFANRNTVIIADKYCHASLNDGAILSRSTYKRYKHQDISHASDLLLQYKNKNKLLLTESIFSMQGCITDIKKLSRLAAENQAMLIVDDAHGSGVLGKNGQGISHHCQLSQKDIPCLITPLGKAFASMGAMVSGSKDMIETLIQSANTYRYSTALPPAICQAARTVLKMIRRDDWRREKLLYLCQFFITQAKARNLKLLSDDLTPIKSIVIACNKTALALQNKLFKQGFFVCCIRPPTVPIHSTCIRISLNCMHEENQIIYLLDQLKQEYDKILSHE